MTSWLVFGKFSLHHPPHFPKQDGRTSLLLSKYSKELIERVEKALAAGVKRWNIIVDPGFGYAKHAHQSIYLLGHLHELMEPEKGLEGLPILAGPSRKGFIGSILNQPDAEVPNPSRLFV